RAEYEGKTGWRFRFAPPDGGRDYGNANVWAFDPTIATMVRDVLQNCRDAELSPGAPVGVVFRIIRLRGTHLEAFKRAVRWEEVLGRGARFATVLFGAHLSVPAEGERWFARVFGRCDLPWHEIATKGAVRQFAGPGWFGAVEHDEQGNERAVSFWDSEALL